MNVRVCVVCVVFLVTLGRLVAAPEIYFVGVEKEKNYAVGDDGQPAAVTYSAADARYPWRLNISVEGAGFSGIAPPTFTIPAGGTGETPALSYDVDLLAWKYQAGFATQAGIDDAYPNGNYTVTANGQSGSFDLTGDFYPNAAPVAVSGGHWSNGVLLVDPLQPLTLSSGQFAGFATQGRVGHILMRIWGDALSVQEESFSDAASFPNAQHGDSVSHTFPAGTFAAGKTYQVEIGFNTASEFDTGYGGATKVALFTSSVRFAIRPASASSATAYLSNLSVRSGYLPGEPVIMGFVVGGGSKPVLMRAAGPALNAYGVPGVTDPKLELYNAQGALVAENDDWTPPIDVLSAQVGAFPFSTGSKDAGLSYAVDGAYTAHATAGDAGTMLVEAYDENGGAGASLTNLSARYHVGTDDNILIAGFVVGGTGVKQVLIRGIGPTLAGYGIGDALVDAQIKVFNESTKIAENDDWDASLTPAFAQVGAFGLPPASRDSALLLLLEAGKAYTVQLSGVNGATGEGLIEIYAIP